MKQISCHVKGVGKKYECTCNARKSAHELFANVYDLHRYGMISDEQKNVVCEKIMDVVSLIKHARSELFRDEVSKIRDIYDKGYITWEEMIHCIVGVIDSTCELDAYDTLYELGLYYADDPKY